MELITIKNNTALLEPQTASAIAEYERTMKVLKEKEDALKKAILEEMEAKGIISIKTDDMEIRYIQSTDTEYFDKTAFHKEHQDIYDDYISMKPKKAYITVKVKP